jgi:hypothetical protein
MESVNNVVRDTVWYNAGSILPKERTWSQVKYVITDHHMDHLRKAHVPLSPFLKFPAAFKTIFFRCFPFI